MKKLSIKALNWILVIVSIITFFLFASCPKEQMSQSHFKTIYCPIYTAFTSPYEIKTESGSTYVIPAGTEVRVHYNPSTDSYRFSIANSEVIEELGLPIEYAFGDCDYRLFEDSEELLETKFRGDEDTIRLQKEYQDYQMKRYFWFVHAEYVLPSLLVVLLFAAIITLLNLKIRNPQIMTLILSVSIVFSIVLTIFFRCSPIVCR